MKTQIFSFAGLSLTALSLTACSSSLTSFLQNMDVSVTQQNNNEYVNLTAVVNLGNVSISGISIPIKDPKTGASLGAVTFGQNSAGQSTIGLSVDETTLSKGDAALGNTLPNGKALPFGLSTTYGDVLALPILTDSRVYLGGDLQSKIIVGVALGISALDGIESEVGGAANLFFSHSFSTSILGMGGIYGSTIPGESGIAVFAQYTPPVTNPAPVTPVASTGSTSTGITTTPIASSTATGTSTSTSTSGSGLNTIGGSGTNSPSSPIAIKTTLRMAVVATSREPASVTESSKAAAPAKLAPDAREMDSVTGSSNEKIYEYFYGKRKVLKVH
jgi:hypothetical protein